jgi:hypothetical protein
MLDGDSSKTLILQCPLVTSYFFIVGNGFSNTANLCDLFELLEYSQTELDGPAVSAFGVRSRKLSNVGHWMSDQKYIISSFSVLRKAR